jgi:hypothetical protein
MPEIWSVTEASAGRDARESAARDGALAHAAVAATGIARRTSRLEINLIAVAATESDMAHLRT